MTALQPHQGLPDAEYAGLGANSREPVKQVEAGNMTEDQMLDVLRAVRRLTPVDRRATQNRAPPGNGASPAVLNEGARLSDVSPAGYVVLGLLDKRCAYQVRGRWRFRGRHSCVRDATFLPLLANGLAEHVETDRHLQIRITPAGRLVNQEQSQAK
jgi:hypothetical protein